MKKLSFIATAWVAAAAIFVSCQKTNATADVVNPDVIRKIDALGFSTKGVQHVEGGYLVEGDIILSDDDLKGFQNPGLYRVANNEQYRTTNLVTALPRTINIRVSTTLPSKYAVYVDSVIKRYNALGLLIKFARVNSKEDVLVTASPTGAGYLGSSGFPSGGKPYNQVLLNRSYLDTWNTGTTISVIAHEIGHCIGFRHTDYMDRSFSCGGVYYNEGASNVGAILIPGTPSGPDAASWMLACIGNGVNRPFNANDIIALNYIY